MSQELIEFEKQRAANIARNRAVLAGLGLEINAAPKPKKRVKVKKEGPTEGVRKSARVASIPKRRYREGDGRSEKESRSEKENKNDEYSDESESDADFYSDDSQPPGPPSKRKRGGYKYAPDYGDVLLPGDTDGLRRRIVNGRNVQHLDPKKRAMRPNPKRFGPIPGIKVGHWWQSRMACSADAVHAPTVGGIYGTATTGAYSVAVSGGYEDDVDEGFRFTFTGSGGRDLKGTVKNPKNLRTAPQSSNQTLTGFNLALKVSCDTGKPVRVIRGFKAALGPKEGYRYDGLYKVLKAWQETGLSGFKVWKFAFKRIDGQAPLDTSIGGPSDYDDEGPEDNSEDDHNIKDEIEENAEESPQSGTDDEGPEDNSEDDHNIKDEIEENAEENPQSSTENADEPKEQAEAEVRPKRTRKSTRKSYRESGGEATSISSDSTAPASKPSDDAETPVTSDESDVKKEIAVVISKKTRAGARAKDKNQPSIGDYLSPKGDKGATLASRSSRRVSGRGKM
ncbi:PUA-like domain-containing protein [Tuber borchii]|uniref:PUA-like domain-containing protein n=1 Tax=Tuber borchii TaxID=42251 RepID=A0A2T6ZMK3_TUBBO|nr:PUA-like domain-containing protein [Tuber borchii]